MFENRRGEGVTATAPLGVTEEHIDRAKDLAMLGMARRKVPYRLIARYFNCSVGTVHNRIKAIPPEAARYYARSLAGVGDAFGPG